MKTGDWQEIKGVFNAVIDLPEDERPAVLEKQSKKTRQQVEKLIKAHQKAEGFISEPAIVDVGFVDQDEPDFYVGKQIDEYEILEEIGHGGMGTVYLASRSDGSFTKKVAIKLIKRGMDTNAVLRRFLMERKILAQLENPNIATLLDGGSTPDGLPYFVMEYIDGLPVMKFCDLHNLDTTERLKLFQNVCAAVSYAHQNLVIHRDLKPSNILVTEDGTPKLLDFGIAKLLHPDWSLDTYEATETMFRVMTPEYASPEQLRGLPITTTSDVFSLGVVLYELLTGERPFKIESHRPQEHVNIISEQEPIRPSAVISRPLHFENTTNPNEKPTTNNEEFGKSQKTNHKSLKGDLDNIILKALRKTPERRYATVQEFSEDIRRHLAGLPVTATADTVSYRVSKFIKRHRVGVFASVLMLFTILFATTIAAWQAIEAKREQAKAQQRFNQVRKLANTILFDYYERIKEMPGATEVREKMVSDSLEYLDNLAENAGDTDLQRELALAYRKVGDIQGDFSSGSNLGKTGAAMESYSKALAIQKRIVTSDPGNPEDRRLIGRLMIDIAGQHEFTGNLESREEFARNAIDIFKKLTEEFPNETKSQSDLARGLWTLASAVRAKGDFDGALEAFRQATEVYEKLAAEKPEERRFIRNAALTYKNMGGVYEQKKDYRRALQIYQKALPIDVKNAEDEPNNITSQMDLSFSYGSIASASMNLENFDSALENFRRKLTIQEKVVAADAKNAFARSSVAGTHRQMGDILQKLKKDDEARASYKTSIKMYEQLLEEDPANVILKGKLAEDYSLYGEIMADSATRAHSASEKLALLREALKFQTKSFDILKALRSQNTLDKTNEEIFDAVKERLQKTENRLANLAR